MRVLETNIEINAPAEQVWATLTDFPAYRRDRWNDYIKSINASLVAGAPMSAENYTPELGERTMSAKMLRVEFPELSWEIKLPVPGVIYARHWFRVDELAPGVTRFTQGEQISGVLTFAVFHLVEKSKSGFESLNRALKERVERDVAIR
jgi:hypothetical protein